jgi:hypothetical protein
VYDIASFTEIAFSVQETVLVTLYVYYFAQYTAESREEDATKAILRLLIGAECVVLSTDIVVNVLLYEKSFLSRAMIQPFLSMLKLKIEFIVLNSLIKYAHHRASQATLPSWTSGTGTLASPLSVDTMTPESRVFQVPRHEGHQDGRAPKMPFFSFLPRGSRRQSTIPSLEEV